MALAEDQVRLDLAVVLAGQVADLAQHRPQRRGRVAAAGAAEVGPPQAPIISPSVAPRRSASWSGSSRSRIALDSGPGHGWSIAVDRPEVVVQHVQRGVDEAGLDVRAGVPDVADDRAGEDGVGRRLGVLVGPQGQDALEHAGGRARPRGGTSRRPSRRRRPTSRSSAGRCGSGRSGRGVARGAGTRAARAARDTRRSDTS